MTETESRISAGRRPKATAPRACEDYAEVKVDIPVGTLKAKSLGSDMLHFPEELLHLPR